MSLLASLLLATVALLVGLVGGVALGRRGGAGQPVAPGPSPADPGPTLADLLLRVFRSSADRESSLLQAILAPALRSRNPERRKEALEALENLAAVASHLKHLLLVRDLRRVAR